MFKNSVLNVSVDTNKWFINAGIRAVKTMAQTMCSMLIVGQTIVEVDWLNVLSVSVMAGLISILTSVAGIPEVKAKEEN